MNDYKNEDKHLVETTNKWDQRICYLKKCSNYNKERKEVANKQIKLYLKGVMLLTYWLAASMDYDRWNLHCTAGLNCQARIAKLGSALHIFCFTASNMESQNRFHSTIYTLSILYFNVPLSVVYLGISYIRVVHAVQTKGIGQTETKIY